MHRYIFTIFQKVQICGGLTLKMPSWSVNLKKNHKNDEKWKNMIFLKSPHPKKSERILNGKSTHVLQSFEKKFPTQM